MAHTVYFKRLVVVAKAELHISNNLSAQCEFDKGGNYSTFENS